MAPRRDIPPPPPEAGANWVYNPELGRWMPPDATQPDQPPAAAPPTTTTPGGASTAAGGPRRAVSPPPANATDEQLDAYYQQQVDASDDYLSRLATDADNAVVALDEAQASGDPMAIGAARTKLQAIQRQYDAEARQKNNYATQQGRIRDRQARAEAAKDAGTMTPEQRAEHEQRMKAFEQDAATRQAQIADNEASRELTLKRLEWEQKKFDAENSPERIKADSDYKAAQAKAQQASADYDTARAAAYPAESAASVGASNASAAANQAQADQIQALIAAGMPAAQAAQTVAQGRASSASAAVSEEELHQKQIGELGVLREQLQKQVDANTLSRADARDALQAAVDKMRTGATPYDRQQQTAASSLAFAQEAMRQGTLVGTNQQYAAGGEPGGAYQQMMGDLGGAYTPQQLHPTPIPRAIQSIGADVNTPYTAGQLGMPSQGAQAGQQGAAGDPRAVQGMGNAQVNWQALSGPQVLALVRGGGGATPQQPPASGVPVVNGTPALPVVAHGAGSIGMGV